MTDASNNTSLLEHSDAIAIVGMAGRFPGARSIEEFWENQKSGTVTISHFREDELEDSFDAQTRASPNFIKARGVLEDAGMFDADLFGMYPREAQLTDPQHRVLLEVALEALEQAAIDPKRYAGLIGVFAGASMPTYLIDNLLPDHNAAALFASNYQLDGMQTLVGSLPDALATRIAYKLGLRGPAMTVQSACSTSLLAVAQACQNLILYQCDVALAGGVSITFPQRRGYLYLEGGMGSSDGHCRPFDAAASGTVFGSGAGVVVLKRLEDALSDGDHIFAVIRGTGVNNDGAAKIGFTAPSAEGQANVISAALANANVEPASIGYVELHGTATPLGDPIEFDGLKRAFGPGCPPNACALGSAKANIGHLDAAAGVTGLIKAALALHHEKIPPLAQFVSPNPNIDLADSPFRIERTLTPWPRCPAPRRAGVSAFGVGGTNVHVVLEEAPLRPASTGFGEVQILPLSARTPAALDAQAQALGAWLEKNPDCSLADVSATLSDGRMAREYRGAIAAAAPEDAARKLAEFPRRGVKGLAKEAPPIIFMFPGQGSQYPGMAANLYRTEPVFREWMDRGARFLEPKLGLDIRNLLYEGDPGSDDTPHPIRSTVYAQPALFLTHYALARLLMSRNVQPSAMIGHSIGEFVAACLSEVVTFEDALSLVARRAKLMQSAEPGAMLAVRTSEALLTPLLCEGVDLAAINAPELCVAAGRFPAVEALEARLAREGIDCRRLHTSHAFHSAMMDPCVDALEACAAGMRFGKPTIPFVSSVTGEWVSGDMGGWARYWGRHCREPVRFGSALETLVGDRQPVLLEVGPGRALTTFARQGLAKESYHAITTLPEFVEAGNDLVTFNEAVGRLWTLGAEPDWSALYGPGARRIPLPTYQFQRKLYWVDHPPRAADGWPAAAVAAPPGQAAAAPIAAESPAPDTATSARAPAPAIMELPMTTSTAQTDRTTRLSAEIADILEDISGEAVAESDRDLPFLELGFDSLFLGQVATRIQRQYGVKIAFRQLLADFPSISALAQHLDEALPPDALPEPETAAPAPLIAPVPASSPAIPEAAAPAPQPVGAMAASGGDLASAFQLQLQAMQSVIDRQLDVLRGSAAVPAQLHPASTLPAPAPAPQAEPVQAAAPPAVVAEAHEAPVQPAADAADAPSRFRAFNPKPERSGEDLTDRQARFIADLQERYCAKMPTAKTQTQAHRRYLADPRTVTGFQPEWKELVYPVVAARSKGSKIWDTDGNEFIDLVNGYGQTMFGHAPDFVTKAVARQLEEGFAIGPQSPLAGEVALKFSEMVGMERVTFCNTGSEAVMASMRVARSVTGREKIVVFNNDYHGQFDEVLVKAGGKSAYPRAFPIAPGIPGDSVSNMAVLPYGSLDSLAWIEKNAADIAAVIVEPVQSRHPELQPFEFLRELRAITTRAQTALVFDEVVTGFRTHPGGMQAVLDIRADMATYGKVVGGGLPVGILAGSARYMDALDGGMWQFGDDSIPEVAPTYFAGTFVRHPLVLAACGAVLDHLREQGPKLQERLATRTSALVGRLNRMFTEKGVPSQLETYSSWFMANVSSAHRLGTLFQTHMRLLGVHVLDHYPCFLTTEHSDADLDRIFDAACETVDALQEAGILAPEGGRTEMPLPRVAAAPREVPMTEPQLEILLAAQMGPQASCAYNESVTLEFDGRVDPAALTGAVQDFIARHDAMRATVKTGEPTLVVAPELRIEIPVSSDVTEAELATMKAEEAATPFDLYQGPLLRGRIARLANGRSALLLSAHHIVFDGWSANILAEELAAFYKARLDGSTPELDRAASFADYAVERAACNASQAAIDAYWRDTYATLPPPLALPSDRPRPRIKTFNGATCTAAIDADLTNSVRKAGAKLGCTLFATLFGALQTTIGRLAEQEDVVLGCPMAGQLLVEDAVLAGHCVNFLPLRAPFSMGTPIGEHLQSVKRMVMTALEHQDVTYGALVRALELPRDPSRTPLTDVQFNLERLGDGIDYAGTSCTLVPNPKAGVNFDLFFNFVESPSGLRVDVDYSTDLFDQTTIERWIENLRQVLRAIVADATTPIGELDILGQEEREWLQQRNSALPQLPESCSAVALFASTAMKHAGNKAVLSDDATLTYAELDARSNQIAHALADRGIGNGDLVALLATRSCDTIVMILGVMKAGAAYVPLDPAYPEARLAYMMEDTKARLLLVGPGGDEAARTLNLCSEVLSFEDLSMAAAACPTQAPEVEIGAGDPIYVMFTSGSTGKPKGIVVPHRAVVRLVTDQTYAHFGPDTVFLHLAPLAFDAATFEIWGALLHGGALAVLPSIKPTLQEITRAIQDHGATTGFFTTALFHAIVDEQVETFAPLKQVLTGGDVVSSTHVRKVRQALPDVDLGIFYGPTENAAFSTSYPVPSEWREDEPLPIGETISRSSVFVVDPRGHLCPRGAPGELFVGGEGVALGYLGRPDLTSQAFVERPFAPGDRLYRTGDMVRWGTDGQLRFIGRIDTQIKINGHRVELDEIASVLRQVRDVNDAVVLASKGPADSKQLHAFVTCASTASSPQQVTDSASCLLAKELPQYMRPATIQLVEAIPQTANGKVDRETLLRKLDEAPILVTAPEKAAETEKLSPLEARVAAIWAEVLNLDTVRRDEAIFDLGADSLQIFRISARMAKDGLNLDNRHLMANPTLGEVAAMLAQGSAGSNGTDLLPEAAIKPLSSYRRDSVRQIGA